MIKAIMAINANVRRWVARILILIGIVIAYTPYLSEQGLDEGLSSPLMTVGWWILGLGLVIYVFNLWLDIKSEKEDDNKSDN